MIEIFEKIKYQVFRYDRLVLFTTPGADKLFSTIHPSLFHNGDTARSGVDHNHTLQFWNKKLKGNQRGGIGWSN